MDAYELCIKTLYCLYPKHTFSIAPFLFCKSVPHSVEEKVDDDAT